MAELANINRLEQVAEYLKMLLKVNCPKDTTNLSRSINIQYVEEGKARIVIGHEDADYAIYTNEPWTSDKWGGKKNPNEGWIEETIAQATPMIQQIMSGEMSVDEVNRLIEGYDEEYNFQVRTKIEDIDEKLTKLRGD